MRGHHITMLGTGLIGDFYTGALHAQRSRDRVRVVYSRTDERGEAFSRRWSIPEHTTDLVAAVQGGAIGDVTWVRSRETHPGPHSAWFWDGRLTGGGAIVDLGCHCIEIIRSFVGKGNRPVEVVCRPPRRGGPYRRGTSS